MRDLAQALLDATEKIGLCSVCMTLTETDPCRLCADPRREGELVCVVAQPSDVLAIERGGHFRGRYHVLHGMLSPLEGIGPDELRVAELVRRLGPAADGGVAVAEVIIATAPTVEGESTAMYLAPTHQAAGREGVAHRHRTPRRRRPRVHRSGDDRARAGWTFPALTLSARKG